MLVEEGFQMVSVDASDKMLKYALKTRWDRRKEAAFDQWGRNPDCSATDGHLCTGSHVLLLDPQ